MNDLLSPSLEARRVGSTGNDPLPPNVGFLNIEAGGVGAASGSYFSRQYEADGRPFPQVTVHIDTDPGTKSVADDSVLIQLNGAQIQAIKANTALFGEEIAIVLKELALYLKPSDIKNGARTTRGLCYLAYVYHYPSVLEGLRNALDMLLAQGRIATVIPVIRSSSGGGTGSSVQVSLMYSFADPAFRQELLVGLADELLDPPVTFVIEPYCYARANPGPKAQRILSNSFAYRIETDYLIREYQAASYLFHIGYSNTAGTILSDPALMARVLGISVYEIERNWPQFKARWVDGADTNAMYSRYPGLDMPERLFPHILRRQRTSP